MAPPPPRSPPPPLVEEMVEEILVRLPAEDPSSLVRAALVCKGWCRLVAGRAFRRRFREFHGAPPMLGFMCNDADACYFPVSPCRPRIDHYMMSAYDARHGRVLISVDKIDRTYGENFWFPAFFVWDPVTEEQLQLPLLPLDLRFPLPYTFHGAVLCAAVGGACDHLDCHRRPFLVVFIGIYKESMSLSVYSSEAGAWGEPIIAQHPGGSVDPSLPPSLDPSLPPAVVGNSVYFELDQDPNILKCDLQRRETSILPLPPCTGRGESMFMTTDEGGLGFIRSENSRLKLWTMGDDATWTLSRVIDLDHKLLPAIALSIPLILPDVVGFAHGVGLIVVGTDGGLFAIDPKAARSWKVGEGIVDRCNGSGNPYFYKVIPYTSFYFPALKAASTGEEL